METRSGPGGNAGGDMTDETSTGQLGDDEERLAYGGGFQHGGGMVEPQEFPDGGTDQGLPNDALAEGLSRERSAPQGGTVDPRSAPPRNDTGDRIGDVAGYVGSDQVVGVDDAVPSPPDATGEE